MGVGADVFAVDEVADLELGRSSAWEMVSRASQVGPNTAEISLGPFLNAFR